MKVLLENKLGTKREPQVVEIDRYDDLVLDLGGGRKIVVRESDNSLELRSRRGALMLDKETANVVRIYNVPAGFRPNFKTVDF